MVHVKDLFNRRDQLRSSEDLAAIKREILFVPESRPLDALQRDFQQRRTHMAIVVRSEEHTSELQSRSDLVCRLLLEKKNNMPNDPSALATYAERTALRDEADVGSSRITQPSVRPSAHSQLTADDDDAACLLRDARLP